MIGFVFGVAFACFLISITAAVFAAYAVVEVMSFKKSTHQVQFVPVDQAIEKAMGKSDAQAMDAMGHVEGLPFKDEIV